MEKKNKVPMKNYIIVGLMVLVVITLTLCAREWYKSYKEYQLTIPVLNGIVQEIKPDEFDNFLREHDEFILYIGVAEDLNCRELEKDMIKVLKEREILENIIYLNITDVKDKKSYLSNISIIEEKNNSIDFPAFLIVKEGKVLSMVTNSNKQVLNISEVEKLLDEYEIGKND